MRNRFVWVTKLTHKSLVRDRKVDDRWTCKQTCFFTLSARCATPKRLTVVKKSVRRYLFFALVFICLPISAKSCDARSGVPFLGIRDEITRERRMREKSPNSFRDLFCIKNMSKIIDYVKLIIRCNLFFIICFP